MSDLVFEKATPHHVDILIAFEQTINTPQLYHPLTTLTEALDEITNHHYYFIKRHGQIIGSASYHKNPDNHYTISNMAVHPSHRRQGIAKAVLNFLLDKCDSNYPIDLTVHPENFRAIPLYEYFGFAIEKHLDNFYGDGEQRALMVKQPL